MRWRSSSGLAAFASVLLGVNLAHGSLINFQDGFEAPTINPFWSTDIQSGAVTLTTAMAHSGSQSAQFSSTATSQNKYLFLYHNFATPIYGTASVWFYDTGAGQPSSNYVLLQMDRTGSHSRGALSANDYDFSGNGDRYNWSVSDTASYPSTVYRTAAWHQYMVEDTPQSLTLLVDGVIAYTQSGGIPFDQVWIGTEGPWWRPAWTYYMDDFSFVQSAAVPEPSSLSIGGIGAVFLFCWSSRRRRLAS